MEITWWIIIISMFLLSFVGIIFPIVPSVIAMWIGFFIYQFLIGGSELSMLFWIASGLLTVILIVSDVLANSYFVRKSGGTKWSNRLSGVLVIVGSFVFPPFGIILLPFLGVFISEKVQGKTNKESINVSVGSLVGFLSGTFAKVVIQIVMIVWFSLDVFVF
jgi:uncharacterized protein YqgC (DUF456 family)